MLFDVAICLFFTALGVAVGMDKVHDIRDYIGPLLIFGAFIYAFWAGMTLFGCFIVAIFFLKVLIR